MISCFVNHRQCYKTLQFPLKALCSSWASAACITGSSSQNPKQTLPKPNTKSKTVILLMSYFCFFCFLGTCYWFFGSQLPRLKGLPISCCSLHNMGQNKQLLVFPAFRAMKLLLISSSFHISWKLLNRCCFILETAFSKKTVCQKGLFCFPRMCLRISGC